MAFDIEMIKAVYARLEDRVAQARKLTGKPLTASEKILYSHLWDGTSDRAYTRGADYVDFAPDRIACQDATAQMALLQFMQAGKAKVAVPTTVHCDHLIQAKTGAVEDLKSANSGLLLRCLTFLNPFQINMVLGSGNQGLESFTKWY